MSDMLHISAHALQISSEWFQLAETTSEDVCLDFISGNANPLISPLPNIDGVNEFLRPVQANVRKKDSNSQGIENIES